MITRKYLKKIGGFTLVELLIVIAILAIIALIVIAAINPIEQANRARDTGQKADGSQLVSAIDRYFASRYEYPWVSQWVGAMDNDDPFGFMSAGNGQVGICAWEIGGPTTDCASAGVTGNGVLITTAELKTEFRNRDFIDAYLVTGDSFDDEYLMVGKEDQSDSVYVCYIPKSNANRDRACAESQGYNIDIATGSRDPVLTADCQVSGYPWSNNDESDSFYVCVPE